MGESELVEQYFESDHIVQLAFAFADGRINDAEKVTAHFWKLIMTRDFPFGIVTMNTMRWNVPRARREIK